MSTPNPPTADEAEELPPKPDEPVCCDSGCSPCVMDVYAEEMREWRARCAEILARRAARSS